jgi:O-acetyl-ADP-ribose deacetylase (regulator of RNase III)
MERVFGGKTIDLVLGDIVRQQVDAIVNAANPTLLGGGGVDGAIHRAGGPSILDECQVIRTVRGECPRGEAVFTYGGRLPARYVIHAVGPVWQGGSQGEADQLAACYRSALRIAAKLGARTVAFPSISTGAYGYPPGEAATIALLAVSEFLSSDPASPDLVRFVLYDTLTFMAYAGALDSL